MALAQVNPGDRINASDLNQFYNILKGVAASGETVTLIYNAAGALIFQPSSDPATGTELIQVKNNAGTVQAALSSDGKAYVADGTAAVPGLTFEQDKTTGLYRASAGTIGIATAGALRATLSSAGLTMSAPVLEKQGANIASAATVDLSTATGNYVQITGTTTITAFGTVQAGAQFTLEFASALKVTYNATSLILDGATDFYASAGDKLVVISEGAGNWREIYRAYGTAAAKYVSANLGADVAMPTANTVYDGPSVSLSPGVWFLTGTLTLTIGAAGYSLVKLWDGTTAIASAEAYQSGATTSVALAVSGFVTLTATTTYKLSAVQTVNSGSIKASAQFNGAGNVGSHIRAVRMF